MGFKKKSYPVHTKDMEAFAKQPASIAIMVDAGYMTDWPHEWTRDGNRVRRRNTWENKGYDGDGVVNDASWHIRYRGGDDVRCGVLPREDGKPYPRIGRLRGEIVDREEGDLT